MSAGVLLQNRIGLVLGVLAAGALLTAATVGLNGYRNTPRPEKPHAAVAANAPGEDVDPLAPKLFDQSGTVRVHVAGAVKKPGVYTLPAWARVIDAVTKAKGFTTAADPDAINLADRVKDGEQIRIPVKGQPAMPTAHPPTPEPAPVPATVGGRGEGRYPFSGAGAAAEGQQQGQQGQQATGTAVNLNTATREELDGLPGIGPATADKIIAYRQEHGGFLQPEDLMNVKGIGPTKFERLRPMVTAR
ncbi:MAG TPA: helix-hairpin-helix domain-containing protein [Armatimonadota bacterium]|nr:helix-hairpin-helix domain-containing protein [Armatimonadota bacterium]